LAHGIALSEGEGVMDKPRYRYNHKTKKWDELFKFTADMSFISNIIRPDGTRKTYSLPRGSWLADHLTKHPEFC
jgi:hypothetical protein